MGIHPGELCHHQGTRNEKGSSTDDPVEKACWTTSSDGGDIAHPEHIEQEKGQQVAGLENRGHDLWDRHF